MTEFAGTLFDGKRSAAQAVYVRREGGLLYIRAPGHVEPFRSDPLAECRITPPLGKTRRAIYLPDMARLETDDSDAMASLEDFDGKSKGMKWVHALESRWAIALCSLAGLLLCVWLFIAYGIPYLANKAAQSVPMAVMETVSDRALSQLDKQFLSPTELPAQQIIELRTQFREIARQINGEWDFRLLIRNAPRIGANAFALPSGKILVTDQLVEMAQSTGALTGVLVHEMAHVRQRHGMRMIFQHAGAFFVISALLGDVVSITSTAAALPTMLVERGYSREFERRADEVAGKYLIRNNGSTESYRQMLLRLSEKADADAMPSLMSTHPAVARRIRLLKRLEQE